MGQTAPKLIPFPLTHFWGISVSIFQFAQGKEKRKKDWGYFYLSTLCPVPVISQESVVNRDQWTGPWKTM
jgi:hypothetical protein